MKINSTYNEKTKRVVFENFQVVELGAIYFGVFENEIKIEAGNELTSAPTMQAACKKAKLLQIGYNLRKEETKECNY